MTSNKRRTVFLFACFSSSGRTYRYPWLVIQIKPTYTETATSPSITASRRARFFCELSIIFCMAGHRYHDDPPVALLCYFTAGAIVNVWYGGGDGRVHSRPSAPSHTWSVAFSPPRMVWMTM